MASVSVTAAVNQCVTPIASSSADHETLSIKHSGSQRMWPFPISITAPPFNLLSVICMATACSVLLFPLIFFFPLLEKNLLVWVQFLIHIGSGRWISPSCSPSLFHLAATLLFRVTQSLHGYSKWMNMLRARAECIYFHKYHPRIIIPLLPPKMSGESFIISKTAHLKAARVYHRRVRKQINQHVSLKKTDYSEDLRVTFYR